MKRLVSQLTYNSLIIPPKQIRNFSQTLHDNTYVRQRLESKFKFHDLNEWYSFTKEELLSRDPSLGSLLRKFGGSIQVLLSFTYPEFSWQAWRFKEKLPLNWWQNTKNQREFLNDLGKRLNVQKMEDWYNVTSSQLQDFGGGALLKKYKSFPGVIQAVFKEYTFKTWRFHQGASSEFWKDPKNQKEFLEDLASSLQITEKTGYYKITKDQIKNHGGIGLLKYFNDSYIDVITSVFPEYDWKPWKFKVGVPNGFWSKMENQIAFFKNFEKEFNINHWEEWYSVTSIQIAEAGGRGFMDYYYSNSPYQALRAVYPQYDWKVWCFSSIPRNFWDNDANVKEVLQWAEKKLDIKKMEDWLLVNSKMFHNIGLSSLLEKYDRNLFSILRKFYPDHKWDVNFKAAYQNEKLLIQAIGEIFSDQEMIMNYQHENYLLSSRKFIAFLPKLNIAFDYIGEYYGDFFPESQKREKLARDIGLTLVNVPFWWDLSLDSLKATIHSLRSDLCHDFAQGSQPIPKDIPFVPKGTVTVANRPSWVWREVRYHREFFETLARKLGFREWRDWYRITISDIENNGGGGLLNMYNGSPSKAVMAIFPEYPFKQWKFQRVPQNFWEEDRNVADALHWVADELSISKPEDWFRITATQLDSMGLKGLRDRFSGLSNALRRFYPNYDWTSLEKEFALNRDITFSKAQLGLFKMIKELFPEVSDMHYNYPHPELNFSGKKPLQLDVYIPSLGIAFEYQGAQHYNVHYMFGTPDVIKQHDLDKKLKCIEIGISLIVIPYWWDGRKESLGATIKEFRNDLLKNFNTDSPSIPIQPPFTFQPKLTDKLF